MAENELAKTDQLTPTELANIRQEIRVGPDGMNFANIEAVYRFGQFAIASNMFPQFKNPSQIVMLYQIKCDTGISFTQALQFTCFINNRASLWGDGLLAAALNTGMIEDINEEMTGSLVDGTLAWTCTIKKKGQPSPIVRTFEWADAKVANLDKKDTYKNYPKRMIQMRARAWALRDSGLTGGLASAEEEDDRHYVESRVVSREKAQIDVDKILGPAREETSKPGGSSKEAPRPRQQAPARPAAAPQAPVDEPAPDEIPFGKPETPAKNEAPDEPAPPPADDFDDGHNLNTSPPPALGNEEAPPRPPRRQR